MQNTMRIKTINFLFPNFKIQEVADIAEKATAQAYPATIKPISPID